MNFDLDTDSAEKVGRVVQHIFADQMPFATSRAINWTALDFQKAQIQRMHAIFDIQEPSFAKRAATISPFSKPETMEARVSVRAPKDRDDVFGKFETEDRKFTLSGRSVAIPTEHVPRTGRGRVKAAWKPKRVLERNFRDGFRAFVRTHNGKRSIWFDEGDRIVPLYWLVPSVPLPPDLEFVETAKKTVDEKFDDHFTRAFDLAIRTAR